MIFYKFDINKFPKKITGPSSLEGFIECKHFSIFVDDLEVFNEPEFFVYEFFSALHVWMNNQDKENSFYFASMDYEEEPVIAYLYDEASGHYRFDSALKHADATVSFQDIIDSYQKFKADLSDQLLKKYGYYLKLEK